MIIAAILVDVGIPEFKGELKMVDEQPLFKRIFIYLSTFIVFLSFDNYLGLGIVFIFSGSAFILLTFF